MSHTFSHGNLVIIGNSDFSGEMIIKKRWPVSSPEITVNGCDLLSFAADLIRTARHARIDNMSDEEILNGA
mgnify:CR=1 FL=1